MSDKNTQLTNACGYDVSQMRFSKPVVSNIPDSKPAISFQRINITTTNPDGSIGDLILQLGPSFSFGVSENMSMDTGKINGYVLPIQLLSKDAPTESERKWVETFNNIVENCKKHILDQKEELGKYDLEASDLKKLNPIYVKKDKANKNKPMDDCLTLYAKLIVNKKMDKITTMFSDMDGEPVDPLSLIGKYCTVNAAIKIESIFVGNKISLQVKLYEAEVKLLQTGMPRLLSANKVSVPKVLLQQAVVKSSSKDEDDDTGSIKDDVVESDDDSAVKTDDDDVVTTPPAKVEVKRIVRKVIKK